MKNWPEFDDNGDLPVGIHPATLDEVQQHFGIGSVQRRLVGHRLERICKLAGGTGLVARFIVFGSFVTAKPDPGDADIFMPMEDSFDSNQVGSEAAIIFDHQAAQNNLGAAFSVSGDRLRLAGRRKHFNSGGSNETRHNVAW